jgi:hypothetical protein
MARELGCTDQGRDREHRGADMNVIDIFRVASLIQSIPPVYPMYLASRIKRGLLAAQQADDERIIEAVGEIETIGDCRYAIPVTDCEGNSYRITVQVIEKPKAAPSLDPRELEWDMG